MGKYLVKECPESLIQMQKQWTEVSISLNQIYNHCVVVRPFSKSQIFPVIGLFSFAFCQQADLLLAFKCFSVHSCHLCINA